MHAYQRLPDVKTGMSLDSCHNYRSVKTSVSHFSQGTAGVCHGSDGHFLPAVLFSCGRFSHQSPVQVLTALYGKKNSVPESSLTQGAKNSGRGLKRACRTDSFSDDLTRAAANNKDFSLFRRCRRQQFFNRCKSLLRN
jgi:hypothetical protein